MFLASLVCVEQAQPSCLIQDPYSAQAHLSLSLAPSLMKWIGSSCFLLGYPGSFIWSSVFHWNLCLCCIPSYKTPSSHDITTGVVHHHSVVGVGNNGIGMSVTQGGGTMIWLANCFVPDICGKYAVCHFKQWPVNSDLRWEANCSCTHRNIVARQLLQHSQNNHCI